VDLALTLLAVIGWILLGLLALLLALILLPFRLEAVGLVDSESEGPWLPVDARARLQASWAFGFISASWSTFAGGELRLCGIRLWRQGDESGEEEEEPGEDGKKKKKKKKERKGSYGPRWALRHRETMLRILGRVLRALRIRLEVAGALGLGDPGDTAVVAAVLRQIHAALPGAELDIHVDYLEEVLVLHGRLSGRIWLAYLAGIALWELPRRDVRAMLAGRR